MYNPKFPAVLFFTLVLLTGFLGAQDNGCPSYPAALRAADREALNAEIAFASYDSANEHSATPPAKNIIDVGIFKRMSTNGVDAAPLTSDPEFLRRIYLDLTGRIPT